MRALVGATVLADCGLDCGSQNAQLALVVVGIGVAARMRLAHLIVVRLLLMVTFGWLGSDPGW